MPAADRVLTFRGRVEYAGTTQLITAVCEHLIAAAERLQSASKPRKLVLGFDMEWQYQPEERPPALIQLCVDSSLARALPILAPPDSAQQDATQHSPVHSNDHQQEATEAAQSAAGPSTGKRRKRKSDAQAAIQATQSAQDKPPASAVAAQAPGSSVGGHNAGGSLSTPGQQGEGYVVYLLHLARLGPTGADRALPALKQLLEHPQVFLVTVGDRDEDKLTHDLGIHPAHLEQVNMMHFILLDEQTNSQPPTKKQRRQQKKLQQQQQQRQQQNQQGVHGTAAGTDQHSADTQQQPSKETKREVVSLSALVGWYLDMRLDKSCQLANEAWERPHLDARMRSYAATDAYAQLLVFHEIKRRLKAHIQGQTAAGKDQR